VTRGREDDVPAKRRSRLFGPYGGGKRDIDKIPKPTQREQHPELRQLLTDNPAGCCRHARKDERALERAAVIAWLRREANGRCINSGSTLRFAAEGIERGEHFPSKTNEIIAKGALA